MSLEREELVETLNAAILSALVDVHTIAVIQVTSVGETMISCKPVINRIVKGEPKELPELIEVPPLFMYGGESYEAYPIAVGDYHLLLISERCFDRWYEGDDFKDPAELRMHDYSDGFALPMPRPRAKAFPIPADGRIWQVGDKYKEGDHEHVGNLTHQGDTTQTGNYTQTGDQSIDGQASVTGNQEAGSYSVGGAAGWSGTFPVHDGRTATVIHGLITDVS